MWNKTKINKYWTNNYTFEDKLHLELIRNIVRLYLAKKKIKEQVIYFNFSVICSVQLKAWLAILVVRGDRN